VLSSLKTGRHWGRKAAVGARRSPQQGCGELGSHLPMTTGGGGVTGKEGTPYTWACQRGSREGGVAPSALVLVLAGH
jgi:hypothetical protein